MKSYVPNSFHVRVILAVFKFSRSRGLPLNAGDIAYKSVRSMVARFMMTRMQFYFLPEVSFSPLG